MKIEEGSDHSLVWPHPPLQRREGVWGLALQPAVLPHWRVRPNHKAVFSHMTADHDGSCGLVNARCEGAASIVNREELKPQAES